VVVKIVVTVVVVAIVAVVVSVVIVVETAEVVANQRSNSMAQLLNVETVVKSKTSLSY
jgi:hypothetical protein